MDNPIFQIFKDRLEKAFDLTLDLYNSMEENYLKYKIENLPSNTIGNQAWCIVGARESYFNAIKNSKWIGFKCSLENSNSKSAIIHLFNSTSKLIIDFINESKPSIEQMKFAFDLLEHEIQHHGQLIRYIYSNEIKFPKSWNERYTV